MNVAVKISRPVKFCLLEPGIDLSELEFWAPLRKLVGSPKAASARTCSLRVPSAALTEDASNGIKL